MDNIEGFITKFFLMIHCNFQYYLVPLKFKWQTLRAIETIF